MKIQEVKWKQHAKTLDVPAELAYKELLKVKKKSNGNLTPNDVVEFAKDPSSVMHSWFTWEDTEAARRYRLIEAGSLIRSIEVVYVEAPKMERRAFEIQYKKKTGDAESRTVYKTAEEAASDPDNHARLIAEAVRTLMAWRKRFAALQELHHLMTAIDSTIESIADKEAIV
jgi:hypothetical protein